MLLYPVFMAAIARRRNADDLFQIDGSALAQILLTAAYACYAVHRCLKAGKGLATFVSSSPLKWLACYIGLSLISTFWSAQAMLTAFRSVQSATFFILIIDTVQRLGSLQQSWKLVACYSLCLGIFVQMWNWRYQFSLSAVHSSLAPGALVGAVFCVWLIPGRTWRIVSLLITAILVLGTSSATFLSIGVALCFWALFLARKKLLALAILGCAIAAVALTSGALIRNVVFYGKSESNIATGSGRTVVWQWAWDQLSTHRLAGFGFAYGDAYARLHNDGGLRAQHMHSALMSSAMNCGALGVALFVALWINFGCRVLRSPPTKARAAIACTGLALMVNTLAMESVTSSISEAWIAHGLFFASAAAYLQRPYVGASARPSA